MRMDLEVGTLRKSVWSSLSRKGVYTWRYIWANSSLGCRVKIEKSSVFETKRIMWFTEEGVTRMNELSSFEGINKSWTTSTVELFVEDDLQLYSISSWSSCEVVGKVLPKMSALGCVKYVLNWYVEGAISKSLLIQVIDNFTARIILG